MNESKGRHFELAASLLPGLSLEKKELRELIIFGIKSKEDHVYQKAAYKALSVILKDNNDFVFDELNNLLKKINEALGTSCSSSRHHRLVSLYFLIVCIFKCSPVDQEEKIIMSVLTEFLFALKEINKKIRKKASSFLIHIIHAYVDKDQLKKVGKLQQLFGMVAKGRNSKAAEVISAYTKGLACLTYEFSDLVSAYKLLPSLFLPENKDQEICEAAS